MSLAGRHQFLNRTERRKHERCFPRRVRTSVCVILCCTASLVSSSSAQSSDSPVENAINRVAESRSESSRPQFLPNYFTLHTTDSGIVPDGSAASPVATGGQTGSGITTPEDSTKSPAETPGILPLADFNRTIYYKNKLEVSLEAGWLPINIPFAFDFLLGDGYNVTPLKYTLVPNILSLRWQVDSVRGPSILRGNWDWSFSAAYVAIPRGPETRYFAYIMGIRRNFVRPKWRIGPFVDWRLGMGDINAKGPLGVQYAQGQNFTFTLNLGSGVRYNFNPRCAISAGVNYMHISNLYLSQPKFLNYGINVYGPMVGIEMRVHRPRHTSE